MKSPFYWFSCFLQGFRIISWSWLQAFSLCLRQPSFAYFKSVSYELPADVFPTWSCLLQERMGQWSSNFRERQTHPEGSVLRGFYSVDLGWNLIICISDRVSGDANTVDLGTTAGQSWYIAGLLKLGSGDSGVSPGLFHGIHKGKTVFTIILRCYLSFSPRFFHKYMVSCFNQTIATAFEKCSCGGDKHIYVSLSWGNPLGDIRK